MIIKTLTLKNYRKFRDTVIEFPDGVTGVIGLNGVGKSTIFEAVAWVLYGPVAARTSADEMKREGAETLDHCRVELEFVFEDDEYRIVREMSGKSLSTSASALVNSKLAASGAETVNKYVQKKLGMDFKSFFTSIFAKQKELNALSSMNASERRPLILKMLGIDSLDEVIKEIKSDKRHKGALVEKLSLDLVDETGGNKIEKYRSEIEKLENKSEKTNLLIIENKEKIKLFNKELKALEKDYLSRKIEYERINHLKEKFEEKKTLFENKKKLIEEINNLRDKIVVREKNVGKHRKKILEFENLEQKIKNVESRLDKTDETTYTIVKKIEQKKTFIESIKISIKRIEYKRKKIEKTGPDANCPTCEKILGDQYSKLLSKLDKEKLEKDEEIKSFLKDINTEKIIYEKACREKQALEKKRKYLQSQLREKERIDTTIRNGKMIWEQTSLYPLPLVIVRIQLLPFKPDTRITLPGSTQEV